MVILMVCLLIGCAVGLRFRVLALVPVIILTVAFVGSGRIAGGDTFWVVLMAVGVTVSLQLGYLIGLCVHHLVVSSSADRSRVRPVSGAPTRTAQ
jgi:uncharacterized membrane protein